MSESPTSATQAPSQANGTGKPSEAGSAFAEALIAAVREQESSEGQAQVATALTLGWFLAALGHPGPPSATAAAARGDLLGAGALDDARVVEVCRSHVHAALTKLADIVAPTGLALPELAEAPEKDRCKQATALDAKVQGVLSATDFRVSKAYAVGRALMNLTTHPEPGTLAEHLGAAAVAPLAADLDDSAAAVAAGAGAVLASLGLSWRGVGKSLGGLAGKLERPLWGAELDVAITQAITLLPRAKGRDTARERRHVALALGASATVLPDGAGSSAVRAADS